MDSESDGKVQFSDVDYTLFVLLVVISFVIGAAVGLKNFTKTTTREFLIGGNNLQPFFVAMSLTGGVVSALSVLGNPTEIYLYGSQLWLCLCGCFVGILIMIFFVLPVLYRLNLVTLMQYLEVRYNSILLQKIGSIAQIIASTFFLGICLYAPSLALSSVTNLSTTTSILSMGFICTIYISIGGVRSVVYTDVFQTTVMFFGTLVIVIQVCINLGGVGEVFRISGEGGRLVWFNLDPSPLERYTFWGVEAFGFYWILSVVCFSQPQYQRLIAVNSLRSSQMVCFLFFVGLCLLWSLFYFSGLAAYATYAGCDPVENKQIEKHDQIIPYLVTDKLSHIPGMAGLFVAAVYGAVLSSVSSQANGISALVWEDFLSNWEWFRSHSLISPTNVTRLISAIAGLLGIGIAFLVGGFGTLVNTAYSICNALISPLDGILFAAVFAPWVTRKGALCGFFTASCFNLWQVIGKFVTGAGKSKPLPLTTEECLVEHSNFTSYSIDNMTSDPKENVILASIREQRTEQFALYEVSYCYVGFYAVFIVLIVSSIVSFATGPNKPDDIDPSLVQESCLKAYRHLWRRLYPNEDERREADKIYLPHLSYSTKDPEKNRNKNGEIETQSTATRGSVQIDA